MSRGTPPDNQGLPNDALAGVGTGAEIERMPVEEPRRAASLTLRSDEVREARAVSMEAANKSLADALRITYRLLQVVMVALLVLFLFSGFQQVNQAESGIRVDLGKIKAEALDPGFQFSLPYPLGEIIKVETSSRTVEIDDSFWPQLTEDAKRRTLDELGFGNGTLNPAIDGSLITGDQNLAHAQWTVVYKVSRPADFVKNLYEPEVRAMVKAAVERAAVRAAAESTIEDLLKPSSAPAAASGAAAEGTAAPAGPVSRLGGIESRVASIAQETLDQIGAGIEITQVLVRAVTPPLRVRSDFNQVQIAQSNAGKARDQALGERSKMLNEVAGSAHAPLLDLIDHYEQALELGEKDRAEKALAEINDVMENRVNGRNITIDGKLYDDVQVSGEVSTLLSEAQQYRSTVVQQAQRQADTFRAKRAQYIANPSVFVSGEWIDAFNEFLATGRPDVFWVPDGSDAFELLITGDPELARQRERERYERDVEKNTRLDRMKQ